jgi:hypothetical protein
MQPEQAPQDQSQPGQGAYDPAGSRRQKAYKGVHFAGISL